MTASQILRHIGNLADAMSEQDFDPAEELVLKHAERTLTALSAIRDARS
jgi:hypothetical protein